MIRWRVNDALEAAGLSGQAMSKENVQLEVNSAAQLRAEVSAAGGVQETTVRRLRQAFGYDRLTANRRSSMQSALLEEGIECQPSLLDTPLDGPITLRLHRDDPVREAKRADRPKAGWPRWRVAIAGVATLALLGGIIGVVLLPGDDDSSDDPAAFLGALSATGRMLGLAPEAEASYTIAHPTAARVDLHDAPDGEVIKRLGPKTDFGSPRTFLVAETRDDWIGVVAPERPNGRLGWLDLRSGQVELSETTYSVHVELSHRFLEIRDGGDLVHRAKVSVGRAGHRTPTGRFAVTDALAGRGLGPWYGCCALAISGHQPNLPPGWVGGDRIAIHGTPGAVGGAVSTGCVRTTDRDMVVLFATVPLGAPVFIRR